MKYSYKPSGVCSQQIEFELDENDVISSVKFYGGCNGNLKGIAALVEGMKKDEAIKKLEGIKCGFKSTSCPDQFAAALKSVK